MYGEGMRERTCAQRDFLASYVAAPCKMRASLDSYDKAGRLCLKRLRNSASIIITAA